MSHDAVGAGMSASAAGYSLAAKFVALGGAGVIGALLIAAADPSEAIPDPKKRRKLIFFQVVTALLVCSMVGPGLVSWLVKPTGWFPVAAGDIVGLIEVAMPVGLVLGGLSWGLIGAGVKLRQLIHDRGAALVAKKTGLE